MKVIPTALAGAAGLYIGAMVALTMQLPAVAQIPALIWVVAFGIGCVAICELREAEAHP